MLYKDVKTMKQQQDKTECSSRRDFLKKSIITAGYAIPTVMFFKMRSTDAWAQNYGTQKAQQIRDTDSHDDSCKTVVDKVFKPHCW
jgi:hypothetical protein